MELDEAWTVSYSPEGNASAVDSLSDQPINVRVIHLAMRLFFRGIYFPQMNRRAWLKVLFQNRRTLFSLTKEALGTLRISKRKKADVGKDPTAVVSQKKAA